MEPFPSTGRRQSQNALQGQQTEPSSQLDTRLLLDPASVPRTRSSTTGSAASTSSKKNRSGNIVSRMTRRRVGSDDEGDDDAELRSLQEREGGQTRHRKIQTKNSPPDGEARQAQRGQQQELVKESASNNSGGVKAASKQGSALHTASYQSGATGNSQAQLLVDNTKGSQTKASAADNSTTDEEGSLRLPASSQQPLSSDLSTRTETPSSSESSVTLPAALQRFQVSGRTRSPLAGPQLNDLVSPQEEWDYAETELWGWIILAVTWIVFVVGMGSCFDVWSWAWDVGQTPYAPPELEDDATLPIVGYYPALMVLTGVVSWIWVLVAWMGIKYFKHAKMPTDDA